MPISLTSAKKRRRSKTTNSWRAGPDGPIWAQKDSLTSVRPHTGGLDEVMPGNLERAVSHLNTAAVFGFKRERRSLGPSVSLEALVEAKNH